VSIEASSEVHLARGLRETAVRWAVDRAPPASDVVHKLLCLSLMALKASFRCLGTSFRDEVKMG
jgi:hypothetical protein